MLVFGVVLLRMQCSEGLLSAQIARFLTQFSALDDNCNLIYSDTIVRWRKNHIDLNVNRGRKHKGHAKKVLLIFNELLTLLKLFRRSKSKLVRLFCINDFFFIPNWPATSSNIDRWSP